METIAKRYIALVSFYTNIPAEVIISKSRKKPIREARQLLMYFLRNNGKMTFKNAGLFSGGKTHSTVLGSCRRVENDFETDKVYREKYSELFIMAKSCAN